MVLKVRCEGLILLAMVVFVFAWLMPNHNPPWTSAYQEFASFLAGMMLLLAVSLLRVGRVTPAIMSFLLFPLVPLVQGWFGLILIPGAEWVVAVFLLGFALMLMVGYSLGSHLESRVLFAQLLAVAFVLGAVLSVWVALHQWLLFSPSSFWVIDLPRGGRPYANLAQPNSLATLLCMGLVGVVYLFERYLINHVSAGLLAVLLIFGVALTQSRTPWVFSVALLAFWSWKAHGGKLRLSVLALLGWLSIYVVFLLALPSISAGLLTAESNPLARAGSFQRLTMWAQLWQAVLQGPIWGYGWGQVSVAQASVAVGYPAPDLATLYSHNILLDLLLWNGPVLGGGVIVLVASWLLRLGWSARSSESLFALLAAGCVLVHAMLEYPLAYAFFLLPLGLLLGLAAAECRSAFDIKVSSWLLGLVLVCSIILFYCFFKEYRIIDEYYRVSRLEEARIVGVKTGVVPEVVLISEPREYVRFVRFQPFEGMSSSQLDWMRKVTLRKPIAFSLFRYALALGLNGRPIDAIEQLKIVRAQFGESVYLQALDELKGMEEKYPQLSAIRLHVDGAF
ncbi:Wzy polymerase domain-containing protein [Pseudomonas sp. MIL19]|uniref:PglL family O-oligosaccharyltransferase n=1 Tax=Pseudomonas sp. MIL19 TaxID=2976979 RepID=UPI0023635F5D|nr:Wzy polymerase domain-containing protein [Pseudomonas sp. MIL19]MDD2162221.1 Wzy polymerase domain-containing protein [Pseudomonas sp. MIL19]